jgi:hypothetical protein
MTGIEVDIEITPFDKGAFITASIVAGFKCIGDAAPAIAKIPLSHRSLNTWRTNDAYVANDILHADYFYVGVDGERHVRAWTINMNSTQTTQGIKRWLSSSI